VHANTAWLSHKIFKKLDRKNLATFIHLPNLPTFSVPKFLCQSFPQYGIQVFDTTSSSQLIHSFTTPNILL